jgi:peptide/nickel transport system permease protein
VLGHFARRLLFSAMLVFAVASGSLLLARLAPGDFVAESYGPNARPETVAEARARYGLDRSPIAQYADWLARAAKLDFGRSMLYDRPVASLIPERAANTAILGVAALAAATFIGLPLGVVSGSRRRGVVVAIIRGASIALLSMPPLLTSLFLVFLAARTRVLPVGGMSTAGSVDHPTLDLLRHLIVPAAALGLPFAAMFERLQSRATHDALGEPFVLATLARGVPLPRVVWRDALKPSLKPIVGLYGVVVGAVLSGSFVVEIVTSWPGLGQLMLDALRARDVYLVAACAGTGAFFLSAGTLCADAALAWIDPRGSSD